MKKSKKTFFKKSSKYTIFFVKLLVLAIFIFGYFYNFYSFENEVKLLAVSEQNGKIIGGSTIGLKLEIKRGDGNVYVNQNSFQGIDTQLSLLDSHKITCNLFNLDCENYNFHYTFDSSNSLVLKGPSAGSSISILLKKTFDGEKINDKFISTGSIHTGGLIGLVGGIDKKIEVAVENEFDKVFIPKGSLYNKTKLYQIQVIEILDLDNLDRFYSNEKNDFSKKENKKIDTKSYQKDMILLSSFLCDRKDKLENKINHNISNTSKLYGFYKNYNSTLKNIENTKNNKNYYSLGSFCFSTNLNLRVIEKYQKNNSKNIDKEVLEFKTKTKNKIKQIENITYINSLKTINDYYIYFLLRDRLNSVENFLKFDNETSDFNKMVNLAFAEERFYTAQLWEKLKNNLGFEVKVDTSKGCFKIKNDINKKKPILEEYKVQSMITKINDFEKLSVNTNLCIYQGIILLSEIDTVLSSSSLEKEELNNYSKKLSELVLKRIEKIYLEENSFPLIPYINYEYSKDLIKINNSVASIRYLNQALNFAKLNSYIKIDKKISENEINYKDSFFSNPLIYLILSILFFF